MKPKRLGRGLRGLISRTDESEEPQAPSAPPNKPVAQPVPPQAALPPTPPVPQTVPRMVVPAVPPPAAVPRIGPPLVVKAPDNDLPVSKIQPNPYQPRTDFGAEDLDDLKASIQEHGVLQPIVVRPTPLGYEVIAGERRLRAAKALGHERIPAHVRQADDEDMQILALVENLQRVDLNAMEKARALQAMMRNFGLTQQEAADRIGKARTSISNLVRLLDLPPEIQDLVQSGTLSGAQARAVLLVKGGDARLAMARRAADEGLTVRRIEQLAARQREDASAVPAVVDPYAKDLEERMRRRLGTHVALKPKGRGGRIVIRYHDAGELDRLLELFGVE